MWVSDCGNGTIACTIPDNREDLACENVPCLDGHVTMCQRSLLVVRFMRAREISDGYSTSVGNFADDSVAALLRLASDDRQCSFIPARHLERR
jgi:hypothetical protein